MRSALILGMLSATFPLNASHGSVLTQAQVGTVDFGLRANLITVEVTINGQEKLLILDTGASQTMLGRRTAQELGLQEAQRGVGRGAGGEVEIAMVAVDQLAVGDLAIHDVTAVVMDLEEIQAQMGGDISGVLGFDFLSRFKVTIDYRARKLTLERYPAATVDQNEPFVIQGDRFTSTVAGISVERPNATWDFVTQTPIPQIHVILKKDDSSGSVTFQSQTLHGLTLDQLIPSVEASLAAQVEDYEKISSAEVTIGGQAAYMVEYTGVTDESEQRFRYFMIKFGERLYSVNYSADTSEFAALEPEFASIVSSIVFLEPAGQP